MRIIEKINYSPQPIRKTIVGWEQKHRNSRLGIGNCGVTATCTSYCRFVLFKLSYPGGIWTDGKSNRSALRLLCRSVEKLSTIVAIAYTVARLKHLNNEAVRQVAKHVNDAAKWRDEMHRCLAWFTLLQWYYSCLYIQLRIHASICVLHVTTSGRGNVCGQVATHVPHALVSNYLVQEKLQRCKWRIYHSTLNL